MGENEINQKQNHKRGPSSSNGGKKATKKKPQNSALRCCTNSTVAMKTCKARGRKNVRTFRPKLKGSACRSPRFSLKMDMISWGQKQFNKRLKKKKKILQTMEAKAAEEGSEISHMREKVAEMVEAVEEKEAELELLRMLHNQLFVDLLQILEAEERLIEILLS